MSLSLADVTLSELCKIEQLADWAAEDGDPDVVEVCSRALDGDTAMVAEALHWWPAWRETHP